MRRALFAGFFLGYGVLLFVTGLTLGVGLVQDLPRQVEAACARDPDPDECRREMVLPVVPRWYVGLVGPALLAWLFFSAVYGWRHVEEERGT